MPRSVLSTPRSRVVSVLLGLAVTAVSAGSSPTPAVLPPTADDEVVATYRDGRISRDVFDSWRAAHPSLAETGDPSLREVGTIALTLHFASEIEDEAAGGELAAALRATEDELLAKALLRHLTNGVAASPEEVEEEYRKAPGRFDRPERVRLRTLFRRFPPDADETTRLRVRQEVAELRGRVVEGADFATLAREHSDSQSRYRGGLVGNVKRGDLAPALEAIVFALPEGGVSEPLVTAEGVHLFFDEKRIGATVVPPDEVRKRISDWRSTLKKRAAIEALDHRLRAAGGDPGASIEELRAEEARRLALHERPELRDRIAWGRVDLLATEALRRRIDAEFEAPTEEEVRHRYETGSDPLRVPPSFRLEAIQLPIADDDPARTHREADEVRRRIATGELAFAAAARAWSRHASRDAGGELGWVQGPRLAGFGPNVWHEVTAMEPGELSPVVQQDDSLWIVRLLESSPRRPATFEEAREELERRLANERLSAIRKRIEAAVLAELDVRLAPGDDGG